MANYLGNYSSVTNYAFSDAVSYGGSTYISLVATNHGNTPDQSPAYWAVLAAQGPVGAAGVAGVAGAQGPAGAAGAVGAAGPEGPPVSFIGGWLTGRAYAVGDAVSYGGSSYIALTANTGREPDVSPFVLGSAGAGRSGWTGGPKWATGSAGGQPGTPGRRG